jgi:hypothetical protein
VAAAVAERLGEGADAVGEPLDVVEQDDLCHGWPLVDRRVRNDPQQ